MDDKELVERVSGIALRADCALKLTAQDAEALRQAATRIESLAADAGRIDWLQVWPSRHANIDNITAMDGRFNGHFSLRNAIDQAMQQETKS